MVPLHGRMALILLPLLMPYMAHAAAPEICRVQGGNTRTIWGAGFEPGKTEVYVWNAPFDAKKAMAALAANPYAPRGLMPAEPPANARKLNILDIDPRGYVLTVDYHGDYAALGFHDARSGGQICWVKNGDGFSSPWPVTLSQPWWVYPSTVHAGNSIRIFGRNLDARLIAIKAVKDNALTELPIQQSGRNSLYECSATLPRDLQAGEYDLHLHNGAGGEAGWSGAIRLKIAEPAKPVEAALNAKDYGAKGNGTDDDTAALRKALIDAGNRGGGTVFLPPGLYPISATLWVPSDVTLKGAGPQNSILAVLDERPMRFEAPAEIVKAMPVHLRERLQKADGGAMVWMRDRSRLSDLGFVDGPGTVLAIFGSHDDCRIERCRVRAVHSTESAVVVEWGSKGFVLRDSEVDAVNGSVFLIHGPHVEAYIGRNRLRNIRPGTANTLFVRALVHSIIEDNLIEDGDRNFCSQLGSASGFRSIVQGNVLRNSSPRRHNSGENMYESASAEWWGPVARATSNSLTGVKATFKEKTMEGAFVLILDGRGLGQYRRIVSHTADTVSIEPAWDVAPDASSTAMVGNAFVEHLWIDNTEENTGNWTGFWGNNFGHVVDGHIQRGGEGLYLWAWDPARPSPVVFCDIIGTRLVGRGNITMRGPLVFGNTVRFSEVIDFRYRPSMHIQPIWLQGMDPQKRAAIDLDGAGAKEPPAVPSAGPQGAHQIPNLPRGAPIKAWNVIEGSHLYDGPVGIRIEARGEHNVVRKNAIHVDKEALEDQSKTTIRK